jgi:hypothetical protein
VGWLSVALEDGTPIPEPRAASAYSGRILVRLPQSLHAELTREAEEEGVSLNQFIQAALAGRSTGARRKYPQRYLPKSMRRPFLKALPLFTSTAKGSGDESVNIVPPSIGIPPTRSATIISTMESTTHKNAVMVG